MFETISVLLSGYLFRCYFCSCSSNLSTTKPTTAQPWTLKNNLSEARHSTPSGVRPIDILHRTCRHSAFGSHLVSARSTYFNLEISVIMSRSLFADCPIFFCYWRSDDVILTNCIFLYRVR